MRISVDFNDEWESYEVDIVVDQDDVQKMVEQGKKTHAVDKKVFALDYQIDGEFADRIVDDEPSGSIMANSLVVDLIYVRVYKNGLYSITGYCKWGGMAFFTELLDY